MRGQCIQHLLRGTQQLAGLYPTCATSPAFFFTPNSQSRKGKRKVEKAANTNLKYLHYQESKLPINSQDNFSVKHHTVSQQPDSTAAHAQSQTRTYRLFGVKKGKTKWN